MPHTIEWIGKYGEGIPAFLGGTHFAFGEILSQPVVVLVVVVVFVDFSSSLWLCGGWQRIEFFLFFFGKGVDGAAARQDSRGRARRRQGRDRGAAAGG